MIRVKLENIYKKFNVVFKENKEALERFVSFFSKKEPQNEFWVLKDISFQVEAGENLGIIGKNGSGKSTLLRTIAGIYAPDSGKMEVNGEVVYLAGFNHGLKPKLTMRENIFLSGAIMGLDQNLVKKRFDEIVDFSGLKDYINVKLYKFSSGMNTKLASSIGLYCISQKNPDILLIDEALGTGADIDFQQKATLKMKELLTGKASVVLVSHNLPLIKDYCSRALWIDSGEIISEGDPIDVCQKYIKSKK